MLAVDTTEQKVAPEGIEPSPRGLKVQYAAFTLRSNRQTERLRLRFRVVCRLGIVIFVFFVVAVIVHSDWGCDSVLFERCKDFAHQLVANNV